LLKFWKKLNELYGWFLIAVFGLVMLIGLWQVYDNYYIFYNAIDESILQYKPDPETPVAQKDSPITGEMVGWLTIDNTNIDYPVMQGNDNTYFLNTDPFGEYSLTGSIFLDSRNSPDFTDDFSLVYGHHMDYGKMFGALDDFLSSSYLSEHNKGTLMVGRNAEKVYDLEIFAAERISGKEKAVFDIEQDRIRQFIRSNTDVSEFDSSSRILGLSTCAGVDSVTRIVVFCYIKER
jgi:sortase B